MQLDRRLLMGAGAGLGLGLATAGSATAREAQPRTSPPPTTVAKAPDLGLIPDSGQDETARLQAAIDRAAERRVGLLLPAGRYLSRGLTLRSGSHITGAAGGAATIEHIGAAPALTASGLEHLTLEDIHIRGITASAQPPDATSAKALIVLDKVRGLRLERVAVEGSASHGIALTGASGIVTGCHIAGAAKAGLFSLDAGGLEISHNVVTDCANNGILVWRSVKGEDGTVVAMNRIERIGARDGGSGQNGNAINVYRAGGVIVTTNRIKGCAYSAVRANSASNVQILANNVARMGEVALYAEFEFDGAVISGNMIDVAATGISVTNFASGGRLATVHGNVIRNLVQRAEDRVRSGIGISVEADTAVTGNVIENAPTAGLTIGWGRFARDVATTGNIIRQCGIGISVTADTAAGSVLIASNMISGSRQGAIRTTDHGRPVGNDLAVAPNAAGRISVTGNAVA